MALDAATLALTARELKAALTEAKIAKIFEPTRDELVLTLRTRTETYSLLLSARSGSARVCLTEESFETVSYTHLAISHYFRVYYKKSARVRAQHPINRKEFQSCLIFSICSRKTRTPLLPSR